VTHAPQPASAAPSEIRRHVVSALVIDRPGTLNRVAGLFRARSFNIESLTVGTTLRPGNSRMTVVVRGDDPHIRQVLAQLERLVEVLEVVDLTAAPRLELELVLVALDPPADEASRRAVADVIERTGGSLATTDDGFWRLSLTAPPEQIEEALESLRGHGIRDLVRAGAVAMPVATAATDGPSVQPNVQGVPA
jgi:acetolactate synthase-1/3 small subunit